MVLSVNARLPGEATRHENCMNVCEAREAFALAAELMFGEKLVNSE